MALITHNHVMTIFVAAIVLGLQAAESRRQLRRSLAEQHEQWMSVTGRVYEDEAEKEKRSKIFAENSEFVENFNSQGNKTFKLSTNRFADLSSEEFREARTRGFTMSSLSWPDVTTTASSLYDQSLSSLPSSVDWRAQGAVSSVREQGLDCGSCWAFSTVASVEGLTFIQTGSLPSLSEQQLIDCVKESSNTRGCNGGNQDDAFKYIIKNGGITAETNYPYQAADGACDTDRASQHAATIGGFANLPPNDEAALINAVAQQPVSAFVDSSGQDFQFYSSGVYTGDCGTSLNHVVAIVGYGTSDDGIDYWLVKNSWGQGWGEDGYMRLQRNSGSAEGRCGIAMYTSYPTAA